KLGGSDNPELDVGIGLRCDYGRFFASKRLFEPLKKRRVTWGYVGESDNPDQDISRGWPTLYSLARTLVLNRKNGTHLLHWPVEEIESLRSNVQKFNEIKLEPGSIAPLDIGSATQVDQDALKATTEVNNGCGCTTMGAVALQAWVQRKGEVWDHSGLRFLLMEPFQS
ncbi:beta-fructofuranosidase, soluble isoenzyme I-like protein, partial [Tanacetum coccineum]